MADVGVVKYKVELDDKDVGKQADKTQSTLTSKLGGAAKSIGAAALATSTAVATAATAAVASLTKQAVAAYAEYEQLTGGVETLFGDAATYVAGRATAAFETAGLSANEYMETVTSFSASLIQSVGGDTEKAAKLADQAIIDMADNANKMGSSMESIQNAYQGFAKQNYTMLDNLKLGYGGTKEEMARLLKDAEKISGIKYDLSSYADVVSAIHVMQESMGIAGTTAEEAASTISGSLAMVKSAWANVVTAIGEGDNEKISAYLDDLIYSVETAAENLLPTVEHALTGIADLVGALAPQIAEKLPSMIIDSLPKLLDAGVQAIKALSDGLLSSIQSLMPTATQIVIELAQMIIQMAPDIVQTGCDLIVQLALGLAQALPELIPMAVDAVLTIVDTLLDNIDMLIDAAIQLIIALADGLIQALPRLIEKAPEIIIKLVEALVRNFPKIVGAGTDLVVKLIEGITKCWGQVISTGADIITQVKNGFSQKVQDALNWGRDLVSNFVQGIRNKFGDVKAALSDLGNLIADLIGFSEPEEGPLSNFHTFAPDMMDLYAKGIDDNIGVVEDSVTDVAKTIAGTFTADVGYNLPDISGYAADLSASMTATGTTEIIVPLTIDGREIARASAWYMNEQLAWEAR
jgi:phage-related protein